MKLSKLIKSISPDTSVSEIEIDSIVENPKNATCGSIFVCIIGARFNGHSFAPDAYRNGCRVFVASEKLTLPDDATIISVSDTRVALAHLASVFYGMPSKKLALIGITGTKGKTTVANLLSQVLNQSGIACGYVGTNGISYGEVFLPTSNTTPDPITLQRALRDMVDRGIRAVALEVSSQAVYQSRIVGCEFDACVFTNLSTDHVGPTEHPSFEHYRDCKHKLFTDYPIKAMISNLDDPYAAFMQNGTSATEIITCSQKDPSADLFAENVLPTLGENGYGISFLLQNQSLTLPMLGKFNVSNALAVLAVANRRFAIPIAQSLKILENASVEGRTETVRLANGACAVIDYAHNGTSLHQLLSALREYKPKRLICLFGSVGERSLLRRRELGDAAAQLSDLAILTSDNPGREDPLAIIAEITKSFEGTKTPYRIIPDRAEAIREAVKLTQSEDILVLAGKGHENYQLIGEKKIPFSERDILKNAEQSAKE